VHKLLAEVTGLVSVDRWD